MKTTHALSIVTALFLFHGCATPQPEVKTETKLSQNEEGEIILREHNITNPDTNQSDTKRYKIAYESPPLISPFDPETLNKKQPSYNEPRIEDIAPPLIVISDKRPVKLSVEKIPVGKFAEVALGSVLGLNYVISPEAAAKANPVSLNMASNMKGEDFFAIVQKIMSDNSLLLSREAGSTIFITAKVPKVDQKFNSALQDTAIYYGRTLDQKVPDSKQITMLVPYYYVDMNKQIAQIKTLALSANALSMVYADQNVIMIKDIAGNIKKALTYIDLFDRMTMKNKTAQIIPLHYVGGKNFIDRVSEILPTMGVPIAKKGSDIGLFMQELPELQSILVLSDKSEWIENLLYWREKLDSIKALGDAPRMFIYQVKNRKADELVSIISGNSSSSKSNAQQNSPTNTTSAKTTAVKDSASNSSLLGDTKILADTNTNSLIIYATPERYRELETVFKTIDTLPRQVLVEVTIAELTLTDKLSYGLEWYLKNEGSQYSGSLQTLGNLGLGSGGLTGSILKNTADFSAMINMFAQKNLISILSTPKIVVLDNQQATINVGTEIPVITSQASSNDLTTTTGGPSILQTVQYRNTGIILAVKPTVNSGGVLTLSIDQTVSEAQQNNLSNISSPLILNRSINTNVVLRSGESVILGGLISENKSDGNTRVPLFGDIPLIGNLFKTTSKSTTKTELIVLVKPIIIESSAEYGIITKAMGTISEQEH